MRNAYKGLAFALSVMLLFSLCLTPAVFATAAPNSPVSDSSAAPPPTMDSGTPPPEQAPDAVSTGEELLDWLYENEETGGTVKLTADITLADAQMYRFTGDPITVDAGNYSITITGEVQLVCYNLTITGAGGTDGLLRVQPGGLLELDCLSVIATDGGTALSQAESSGLLVGDECTVEGDVRYAQLPYIWYWNVPSPLVVVGAAQTAQLPETISAQVNEQGQLERRDVPVIWALDAHEQAQAQRRRFCVEGSTNGYTTAVSLVCTVVYNDFPLTFTSVTTQEKSWYYRITGGFTKPEKALPIMVTEEYSFDGSNWTTYHVRTISKYYHGFDIELQKDTSEPHCWDTVTEPYLYLRLHWNDGTNDYFSNQLRFTAADFGAAEDIGGTRGGGIDITDPPGGSNGDSDSGSNGDSDGDTDTIVPPGGGSNGGSSIDDGNGDSNGSGGGSNGDGDTTHSTPAPKLKPASSNVPPAIPAQAPEQTPPSAATIAPTPDISPAGISKAPAKSESPPATPKANDGISEPSEPPTGSEHQTPPAVQESVKMFSAPEADTSPKHTGALPIAAGCAAVACTVGAAGLCLHPQVLQRLVSLLRTILLRK